MYEECRKSEGRVQKECSNMVDIENARVYLKLGIVKEECRKSAVRG